MVFMNILRQYKTTVIEIYCPSASLSPKAEGVSKRENCGRPRLAWRHCSLVDASANNLGSPSSPSPRHTTRRTMSDPGDFLDSAEGEVSLFRSVMRTRPVGIHRHVHILAIHNSIYRDTGFKVPMQDIWAKLGKMYDLDVLEHSVSSSSAPRPCQGLPIGRVFYYHG